MRPAYDVDLDAWKNRSAFHPANTRLKQLGHELVRKAIVSLGELLHWLLPPGPEKSTVFTRLDDVRMWAAMALAVGGGPREDERGEGYAEAAVASALRQYEDIVMPTDPRIREYEAEQRGEAASQSHASLDAALEAATADGSIFSQRPGLPGADADAPRTGLTGAAVQQAAQPGIVDEKPTAPADQFEWETTDDDGIRTKVKAQRGVVSVTIADTVGDTGGATRHLVTPFEVNQFLSAIAAAGDRAFTG